MSDEILDEFRAADAILEGHFQLSSGLHSDTYLQCARVLMDPRRAERLCRALAKTWDGPSPNVVVGPALGGVTLAYEMARQLGGLALFAERTSGGFAIRRGFDLGPRDAVLVAEDVVTTGGSVREVIELVRRHEATVLGVVSLVHRGDTSPFEVPFKSLLRLLPETWKPNDCPLCATGDRPVKPGSRPSVERDR